MLIEIPVTVSFDIDGNTADMMTFHRKRAGQRVFTMRYETDPNTKEPAKFCIGYPPTAKSYWMTDGEGVLFELLTSDADKTIAVRAKECPESYLAVGSV